jgi:hypothetical protein
LLGRVVFAYSSMDWPGSLPVFEIAAFWTSTSRRPNSLRTRSAAAVFRHQIDACANAAHDLATKHGPGEALARWLQRYAAFIGTKRGLAKALHSGNPAFDTLPAYFNQRLEPALRGLLESVAAAGEVRTDVAAEGLLGAVAGLCMQAYNKGPEYASRMVALLVDGLRYGASTSTRRL